MRVEETDFVCITCHICDAVSSPCAVDLGQYMEDLNATGDLSTFVLNARRVFVESCQR